MHVHRTMTAPIVCAALLLSLALLSLAAPAAAAPQTVADVTYTPTKLVFTVNQANEGLTLAVNGAIKYEFLKTYRDPITRFAYSIFDNNGQPLKDGRYTFEVRLTPRLDPAIRAELQAARKSGDMTIVDELCEAGLIPLEAATAFGYFTVFRGRIQDINQPEGRAAAVTADAPVDIFAAPASSGDGLTNVSAYDFLINDDLIVDGSACIGFDCVNGESFGFDTLRLKENNLRIKFDDTSVAASFPRNDWQLTANDSANGGASKFSIDDISGGRTPFTVEANAPSHSLYVDDGGRIGNGTSTPSVEIHTVDGDTPTLRLQQDGSSGFAPQTWDVAGNETNFFVRDVTNGSALPFRIRPSAPTNSIFVDVDGSVGMGTSSPSTALHVRGTDGDTAFRVEEASATESARVMATLENNGRVLWLMTDTSANGTTWRFRTVEGQFNFDSDNGVGNEFVLDSSGNLTILGTLTQNSNRESKNNIAAVDPQKVLQKVVQLPIATWTYKKDQEVEHLGPMAQDFHEAFGLGASNIGITTYDTAGVALASIQALYRSLQEQQSQLEQKQTQLDTVLQQNALLLERMEALEAKVK